MSTPLIWVLVAVVVVLVLAAVLAVYLRRRRTVYRDRAEELRRHALFQSEDIPAKEADARGARAAADEARRRAEEMEAEARQKEAALERARSRVEDTVREADRIDPEVRHKSGDYVPSLALDVGSAESGEHHGSDEAPDEALRGDEQPTVDGGEGESVAEPTDEDASPRQPGGGAPYEQPAPPGGGKHAG